MSAIIHDVEQGTDAWRALRAGVPTASEFSSIMSQPSGRTEIPVRTKYLYQLAYERISGEPLATYKSEYMDRGNEEEPHARSMFEFLTDVEVNRIGFVTNDSLVKGRTIGCSPDGFVGDKETVEIKWTGSHRLIQRIMGNDSIGEHLAQCQGSLWVCERDVCNLVTYTSPKMPLLKRRIKRDDNYIAKMRIAIEVFCDELDEVIDKIKRYAP